MSPELYTKRIEKWWNNNKTAELNALHGPIGISGEAGELLDMFKKHVYYGKEIDKAKLCLELGDILFYLTMTAKDNGFSLDDVMTANVQKLTKRFGGDSFDAQKAINKDSEAEELAVKNTIITQKTATTTINVI